VFLSFPFHFFLLRIFFSAVLFTLRDPSLLAQNPKVEKNFSSCTDSFFFVGVLKILSASLGSLRCKTFKRFFPSGRTVFTCFYNAHQGEVPPSCVLFTARESSAPISPCQSPRLNPSRSNPLPLQDQLRCRQKKQFSRSRPSLHYLELNLRSRPCFPPQV